MSGARILHETANALIKVVAGIAGWLLLAPVAYAFPRRRDWLAVIGRDEGKFVDNAKYFFLQGEPLLPHGMRMVFVTGRFDVRELLKDTGYQILNYPSWRGIWFLLRTGTLVVDSSEWVTKWRRFLLTGSRKIQLWHGVGYKRIELDKWQHEAEGSGLSFMSGLYTLRVWMHRLSGRLVRYDVISVTSEFYKEAVFRKAMLADQFLITGYPRNSFGELGEPIRSIAWRNTDQNIARHIPDWLAQDRRIVLVAPTFRDSRATSLDLTPDTVATLNEWCHDNRTELIFKFHPLEKIPAVVAHGHLHLCSPDSDLYPLMPVSSALITDYSSIYMDYLLLDKPVFFYVPDLEEYIREDRQLQFDLYEMTPGPKLQSWRDVVASLSTQWRQDTYTEARARLKQLAFDGLPQQNAVPKLIEFMHTRNWIGNAS